MCEILAPAGNEKSFFAAIDAGADAVYLGLSDFSARKNAENFNLENLKKYLDYAHILGVKVYVAMNTLVKDNELDQFIETLVAVHNKGADAIIVQDLFLGKLIKEYYPDITLHLSTQAGVCNVYGARLAVRYGFSRVILSRETPLNDIREIASIVETEVFVQGALCTCFSGQCYLSAYAGGNSGNRGLCKQPCRKKYKINRKGFDQFAYSLSLSDLCSGKDLEILQRAGVASFKIEGRMRSSEYVRASVVFYRDILDGENSRFDKDFSSLRRSFNRGNYTSGYLKGQDKNLISRNIQNHMGERVGTVRAVGKYTFIESEYVPKKGDGFKVIRNGITEVGGFIYREIRPRGRSGFYIDHSLLLQVGDGIYLTSEEEGECRNVIPRRRKLVLSIHLSANQKVRVTARGDFGEFFAESDFCAEMAVNAALRDESLRDCFLKTDGYPYEVVFDQIDIKGELFIVRSSLNAFRRNFYVDLTAFIADRGETQYAFTPWELSLLKKACKPQKLVIDTGFDREIYENCPPDYFVLKPQNYKNISDISNIIQKAKYYVSHILLYVPAFSVGEDIKNIYTIVHLFDGLYCEGAFGIELGKELAMPMVAGCGVNIFNRADLAVLSEEGVVASVLSRELSLFETEALAVGGAFVFSGGAPKVMDLGYCVFSKTCKQCDCKSFYKLTDEAGREFPLHRYENSECRFEIFNCAPIIFPCVTERVAYDFTALDAEKKQAYMDGCEARILKGVLGSYTAGLLKNGVK